MLRNILKKRIFWILFGLAVLGALLLIAMPIGMDYGIERYFLTHGAYQTDVEDVDFNPFTRRLVIKDLVVRVGDENILTIARARLRFAWSPFFKKRFLVQEFELSDSDIAIEELPDGRWRIAGLLPEPSSDPSSPSSWGFGLVNLQVRNSRVKLRSMKLISELKVKQARLTGLQSWLLDQKARLEFDGQLNDGKLKFQGDFSPFSSGTIFDGDFKLQGLTLTPFPQLIAADPETLQGKLDTDGRIKIQYSSAKGFNFDQTGRLALKQTRIRFDEIDLADENLALDGKVQVNVPAASGALQITIAGQLDGKGGSINQAPDKLAFQHKGLDWNGKFVLHSKIQTAEYSFDGALALQDFKMASPEINMAEERVRWDGNVQIIIPDSPRTLAAAAVGNLAGKGASLDLPSANFNLQGNGLNWSGEFAFAAEKETADVKLDGDLKFAKLEAVTDDALVTEEDLSWSGGFELLLPEKNTAQSLTTNGKLESRRQTINLLRHNLNFANENLSWEGRFDGDLRDFAANIGVQGDFALTNLAVTAPSTAANITGLNLISHANAPGEDSLLSIAEMQMKAVKLEQLEMASIESVHIVTARGTLHHKEDGRWRYIDELQAFLTDPSTKAPRKQSPGSVTEKFQPPAKKADVQPGIRIESLEITGDSVLNFQDETVSPTFRTDVRLDEARMTNINSYQPETASSITLKAGSRKYTRLSLQGNVQPFTERISMDLKGKIRAIELPPLSPYAAKTIGYNLTSGEMDADIDLKIIVGKLEGEGDLKFYNPRIEAVNPQTLENKEGSPIPLSSALKVLRDKDDDVRLKIPISGDVSNPQFSFSKVINQAITKGVTIATLSYLKYTLGPYGTAIGIIEIGAKIGEDVLSRIRLEPIEFHPGNSEPDSETLEYLDKVAVVMKEKKDVRLRLCGWATENDRLGQQDETNIPVTEPDRRIAAPKDARFPLSDENLLNLAEQRASQIEDILVSRHGIADKRIFVCKPEIDADPDGKPRVDLIF